MVLNGNKDYHAWAMYIGQLIEGTVSKVSLWKRMGKELAECLQAIMEQTFHLKLPVGQMRGKNKEPLFSPFGETYLQHSTIISLPDELSLTQRKHSGMHHIIGPVN
jgi:hypothetical protein